MGESTTLHGTIRCDVILRAGGRFEIFSYGKPKRSVGNIGQN